MAAWGIDDLGKPARSAASTRSPVTAHGMSSSEYRRRLHLTRREYQEVLSRMESRCGNFGRRRDERRRERHDYHVADIPFRVEHPEGGSSTFLVFGRNISRRGISILHGGFVHAGSRCRVVLARMDGKPIVLEGEVRHCRLFAGSCHEIGIHFDSDVDPGALQGSLHDAEDEAGAEGQAGARGATGTVLVAESFAPDHLLLEHHLSLLGLEVQIAETPGATLDAVKLDPIDLVLYGLPLRGRDGVRVIEEMRRFGFKKPIMVLTAESDHRVAEAARRAGADLIISKPYNIDFLLAQLRVYLSDAEPQRPQYSTASDQPGMPPLIGRYVELVRRTADQVERTYKEAEWDTFREYCHQLKGSGCSYGFHGVTTAAIAVLQVFESGPPSEELGRKVTRLLECCRALELAPA